MDGAVREDLRGGWDGGDERAATRQSRMNIFLFPPAAIVGGDGCPGRHSANRPASCPSIAVRRRRRLLEAGHHAFAGMDSSSRAKSRRAVAAFSRMMRSARSADGSAARKSSTSVVVGQRAIRRFKRRALLLLVRRRMRPVAAPDAAVRCGREHAASQSRSGLVFNGPRSCRYGADSFIQTCGSATRSSRRRPSALSGRWSP